MLLYLLGSVFICSVGSELAQTPLNLNVVAVFSAFKLKASLRYLGMFFVTELMSCEELHSILHLVLQAGNIMNAVSKIQKN